MTRTPTHPPPTDPIMRRKPKALTRPDNRGDHELFTWTVNQIETACSGSPNGSEGGGLSHPHRPTVRGS